MRVLALSVCALGFLAFAAPAVHAEDVQSGSEAAAPMMKGQGVPSSALKLKGKKMMQKIDTNGDGKISKDEYMAMSAARFKNMDTNHDGFLSPEEHKAAHQEMKDKMQERKQNMKQRKDMSGQ